MDGLDQQAFDLGWDFALFGVHVPTDASKGFCDGYRAFGTEKNKTTRVPDRYVRKWLQIRFGALRRRKHFAPDVTPQYIEQITPASGRCPVTGLPFTYSQDEPTDWSVDRANVGKMLRFVCRTKEQRRAFVKLAREVLRRSKRVCSYTEIWATERVQRRFGSFVASLDAAGLIRLAELQANTMGDQNTKLG